MAKGLMWNDRAGIGERARHGWMCDEIGLNEGIGWPPESSDYYDRVLRFRFVLPMLTGSIPSNCGDVAPSRGIRQ